MYRNLKLGLLVILLCSFVNLEATTVKGRIQDADGVTFLTDMQVRIIGEDLSANTDDQGNFELEKVRPGTRELLFLQQGIERYRRFIDVPDSGALDLGIIVLPNIVTTIAEELPTINLSGADFDDGANSNISGLLNARTDVYQFNTRFTWGTRRFRFRGLESRNQSLVINGISANDLEFGQPTWYLWSGLNDVTRNSTQQYGIVPMEFSFGGLMGGTNLDVRASSQWKQTRVSYSLANATYAHRLMATHSSGWLENGWAYSLSGSRRVSQEGFIEGTFYDAYGYFVGVSKKIGENNQLHFNAFGTPNNRGRNGATVQEMYDLTGTNYYNPYWGYQGGKKRNSRVAKSHTPVFLLTHDVLFDNGGTLTNTLGYRSGQVGATRLDWFEANNPDADYYRRLPSNITNPELADRVAAEFGNDENSRQVDWEGFYRANELNVLTIENADGIPGNNVTGRRSQYVVEEQHYDPTALDFQSTLSVPISDDIALQGGIYARAQRNKNYKIIDDLLGGDFYLDLDRFAIDEPELIDGAEFNNLELAGKLLAVGDTFGWNYDTEIRNIGAWWQIEGSTKNFDYFFSTSISQHTLWRVGNVRNGKFPDSSLGASEKARFTNYGVKGGLTYKINGRNYIYLNAMSMDRAPYARAAFVSARTRNEFIPTLTSEKLWGTELTYHWRSPALKLKATAYINELNDQVRIRNFFIDDGLNSAEGLFFGNYITSNIDQRNLGVEFAGDVKITGGLSANAALTIGQHFYTDRMRADVAVDNQAEFVLRDRIIYTKNFFVPGTSQSAYKAGLAYRGKKFWSLWLDVSYLNNFYLDFSPERRTVDAVSYPDGGFIEKDSELWKSVVHQEKLDGFLMVDLSVRKSWKLFDKYFLLVNIGINNLLNNQDYITGGFEQLRFDYAEKNVNRFANRYYYGLGLTYFANVTLRM